MRHVVLVFSLLLMLTACGEGESFKPKAEKDERWENQGKLTGEGGLTLFGGKSDEESGTGGGKIGVNSYLWRASLDTLSFMPLVSADPFGGVIITDWYEDPKVPGERFKVNVLILDRSLRADGVKLSVFKQRRDQTGWRDQQVDETLARSLEDTILTRARQLKVSQLGK
jgi:hypothetical protein